MEQQTMGAAVMDDHEIMLAVRDGDIDQLGILFRRRAKHLYHFFLAGIRDRDICEDLVQEVFMRMLKYRRTYRGDANFMVWMFAIARNVRADHFRKAEFAAGRQEYDEISVGCNPNPENNLAGKEDIFLVRRALAKLPEDSRDLLLMSKFKNIRYRDIGTLLNCSEGAVKVRVFRAMRELKAAYYSLKGAET